MLAADRIHLRPVERGDLGLLVEWRNDAENRRAFFNQAPLTLAGQEPWLARLDADPARQLFIICRNEGGTPLGTIGLDRIDVPNRHAEYGNLLIGEATHRRQGFAAEASLLLLDYAFRQLDLHRLHLCVFSDNRPAIRLYERLGFVAEGVAREHVFVDAGFRDVLHMGCLRGEFEAAVRARAADARTPTSRS